MILRTRKNGFALIWSLLMISIILIVTNSMASYIIRESQMSVRIEDSIQAYALAQSGIEWAKLYVTNNPNSPNVTPSGLGSLGDIFETGLPGTKVDVTITKDVATDKVTVISQALYAGVSRKLQYLITPNAPERIENDHIGPTPASYKTDKSYDFTFNLWKTDNGIRPVKFGISNVSTVTGSPFPDFGAPGLKTLGVSYNGIDRFTLFAWNGVNYVASNPLEGIITDIPAGTYAGTDSPYALKIKVRYLEGTAAQMTISRVNKSTGEYYCNSTATIDLTGIDFSMPLATPGPGYFVSDKPLSTSTAGDGNVLTYTGGYIDNVFVHGIHAVPGGPVVPPPYVACPAVPKYGNNSANITVGFAWDAGGGNGFKYTPLSTNQPIWNYTAQRDSNGNPCNSSLPSVAVNYTAIGGSGSGSGSNLNGYETIIFSGTYATRYVTNVTIVVTDISGASKTFNFSR